MSLILIALFDALLRDDIDQREVVELMNCSEDKLVNMFSTNMDLRERYLVKQEPNNEVFAIQEQDRIPEEPETDASSFDELEESDEEDDVIPPANLRMFKASSSGVKKEQGNEYPKKRKTASGWDWNPPETYKGIPTFVPGKNAVNDSILDLDCIPDQASRKKLIDSWYAAMNLTILTNRDSYNTAQLVLVLFEHKSTGNVQNFIKQANWDTKKSPEAISEEVLRGLYTMFLGLDYTLSEKKEQEKLRSKAEDLLAKAELCNICELDSFTCFYEKQINHLPMTDWPKWIDLYLSKIPIIGMQAKARWTNEKSDSTNYSLMFATEIVRAEIAKICDLQKKGKQLRKFNKCCPDLSTQADYRFGCYDKNSRRKPKKHSSKKKSKKLRRVWKKRKNKFSPGKYFFDKKTKKPNFCPAGKKKCRCWICTEEGHYANECPNRNKHSEKVKILEERLDKGFYPVEDPYTNNLVVYSLQVEEVYESDSVTETEPETSSEESNSDSSDDE
uniref:Coat protein n=1 Tax=Physostegia virginiana caulimovirus 2 TaxID=3075964 RepID=A0AA95Z370_9VIRU|nr:coat protein [Physostegia virginiana caulimovirus 2]